MQIETDGTDLIFTPEKDEEYNQIYLSSLNNNAYFLRIEGREIKDLRISKNYLSRLLLQEST